MNSNELILKKIDDAILVEERMIPFAAAKIKDNIFLSSFDEKDKNEIVEILKTISEDSKRHLELMQKIKKDVIKNAC